MTSPVGQQHVGGLEAADQRQPGQVCLALPVEAQLLPGRIEPLPEEPQPRPVGAADADHLLAAGRGEPRHLGALGIVEIDDGHRLVGQNAGEQPGLGAEIGAHRAVVVEMVLREVREAPPPRGSTPSSRRCSSPCEDASIAAWVTPAAAASARQRCSVTGSGVVWRSGQVQAPSTPVVPRLIAVRPSATHSWRQKLATEVLPLVPVTATIVSGWAPNHRAAARARVARGSSATTAGRLRRRQRRAGLAQPLGIGEDRRRPPFERSVDEARAMDRAAGQRREQEPLADLARIGRQPPDRRLAAARGAKPEFRQ